MKPLKLTLCGWGPYKDKQVIDFTGLERRGLFLITGATGAGKTSIFDAVMYALYGCLSSGTRDKNSVRSDFADGTAKTYAELLMEHGGKRYKIYRNPEYLRPAKRKGASLLTREKENAVLTWPDGKVTEGSSEVTKKIQELLRLDYRQYKQLSMIAQGEFSRFLSASSQEKTKIFREIFETENYGKLAGSLHARSGELYRQIMEYRHKMDEDIEMYVPDHLHSREWVQLTQSGSFYYQGIRKFLFTILSEYRVNWEQLMKECSQADRQADEAAGRLAQTKQVNSLFDKLAVEKERLKQLKALMPEQEQKQRKLERAQSAAELKQYDDELNYCIKSRESLKQKIQVLKTDRKEIKKKADLGKAVYEKKEKLLNAYEEQDKLTESEEAAARLETLHQKEEAEYNRLKVDYLRAEEGEEQLKQVYERADKSYRYGLAGILAGELIKGKPCPVCGSLSHPEPAAADKSTASLKEVEACKKAYEDRREERVKLHGRTLTLKERADGLLQQKLTQKKAADEMVKKQDQLPVFIKEYVKEHSKPEWEKEVREQEMLMAALSQKENSLQLIKEELLQEQQKCEAAGDLFLTQINAAGFQSEKEYREAALTMGEMEALRSDILHYKELCHANNEMQKHLLEETKGKKMDDLEGLIRSAEEIKSMKESLYEKRGELQGLLKSTEKTVDSLKEKQHKLAALEKSYALMKDLDDAAGGNNKKRLVFEQYVLASYFEEILKSANIRLRIMTGGRYEMKRMEQVADGRSKDNLEIEVFDYYTGRERSVKTLSGGETFKVSLALALGMSDVVQAKSGGIRVETLFIDEGFGSLDSESLEQACLTLQSLVQKDRLIGIISHVPELSEKIDNQIRVRKTNTGSNIQVMIS